MAGAALLGLGACAVGPHYSVPDTSQLVPGAYPVGALAQPSTVAPVDAWWEAFGDPQLDELVNAAFAGSPDLAVAESRVAQARALAAAAGSARYPQLSADGRVGRDKLSLNGENLALIPFTPSRTAFTDYRVGFDASWEIDLFGHTRRQVEAAIARAGSAQESRNDARTVLAAEVVRNYLEHGVAVKRLAVARDSEAAFAQTARLVGLPTALFRGHAMGPVDPMTKVMIAPLVEKAALTQSLNEGWLMVGILFALALVMVPLIRQQKPEL